jgi:hypothetical protein
MISAGQIVLAGFAGRQPPQASGVESDIWARAVVIQDPGGSKVLILTLDLLAITPSFSAAIRAAIAGQGFNASNSIITATHTHSAPVTTAWPTWETSFQQPSSGYMSYLQNQSVQAVDAAVAALQPAQMSFSRTSANVGYERYFGPAVPTAWYDQTLDVIRAVATSGGSTLATLFSYGCHPIIEGSSLITPDYPGPTRDAVESSLGGVAVFLQGFAGSVNPQGSLTTSQVANSVASAVVGAAKAPQGALTGSWTTKYVDVALSLDPLPSSQQLQAASNYAAQNPNDMTARAIGKWSSYVGGEMSSNSAPTSITQRMSYIRLGTGPSAWGLLAVGHEVVSEYALLLRQALAGKQLTMIGYADAVSTYVPNQEMLAAGSTPTFPVGDLGDYEGGSSFLWYGWPARLRQDVEDRMFVAASSLDVTPGTITGTPTAVIGPAGTSYAGAQAVYARRGNGNLYATWQTSVGGNWNTWTAIGGTAPAGGITSRPSVVVNASGIQSLYARGADGNLYVTWQSGSGWAAWTLIGGAAPAGGMTGTPTAVIDPPGTAYAGIQAVYARCGDGNLYTTWQTSVGGGWAAWTAIGGPAPAGGMTGAPSVIIDPAGMPYAGIQAIYARCGDGNLYTTWQTSVGGGWAAWTRLGVIAPAGGITGTPTAVINPSGTRYGGIQAIYARGADGNLYTTWQTSVGGGWAAWTPLGGTVPAGGMTGIPAPVLNPPNTPNAGIQAIFARCADGKLYTTAQASPGSGWGAWTFVA